MAMVETDKPMYYGARPETFETARKLRNRMTQHEKLLWDRLKNKQICNVRFRRQHPISFFIADFYCHEARLVVEIDGVIHGYMRERDSNRTAEMERYMIKVIRFENAEVEKKIDEVVKVIDDEIRSRIQSPPWGI